MKKGRLSIILIITLILTLLGIIEYIPIPSAPLWISNTIHQLNPLFISILSVVLLCILYLIIRKDWIIIFFLLVLIPLLFRDASRDLCNRITYNINKETPVSQQRTVFLGTTKKVRGTTVIYEWHSMFGAVNSLVYTPHHGLKNNNSEVEIIIVYDKNWYESKIPLLE